MLLNRFCFTFTGQQGRNSNGNIHVARSPVGADTERQQRINGKRYR